MKIYEKRLHDFIKTEGCVICKKPADIHHILDRKHQWAVIGLCPNHHRPESGFVSVHGAKKTFINFHGSEWELFFQQLSDSAFNLEPQVREYINSGHAPQSLKQAYSSYIVGGVTCWVCKGRGTKYTRRGQENWDKEICDHCKGEGTL